MANRNLSASQEAAPLAANERLCFIHIEKSGGTTVHHLLRANHGAVLLFPISLEKHLWPKHYRSAHAFHLWLRDGKADRRTKANAAMARFNVIGGHCFYGIHTDFDYSIRYLTVLRNPEDRIVSQYHHDTSPAPWTRVRRRSYFQEWCGLSLEEWAERRSERRRGINLMVRRLAGRDCPAGERLARAQANLQQIEFVLFTDTLTESLRELATTLDWQHRFVRTRRIGRYERRMLSARERAAIVPLIDQDLELFNSAAC